MAPKKHLLEALREAAYAGRVKFRAIKDYGPLADGLKDIETICFYYEPSFNWPQDEISSAAEETPTVWCCVHLDREQFASLLTGMGYSVRPSSDDVQAKLSIYKTGLAGRPSAMHLILPMAEARLDAGDCPRTKTELARQLVDQYKKEHPQGPRGVTVKTIRQNEEFQELWRQKGPK